MHDTNSVLRARYDRLEALYEEAEIVQDEDSMYTLQVSEISIVWDLQLSWWRTWCTTYEFLVTESMPFCLWH